jgi:hypothetical protein
VAGVLISPFTPATDIFLAHFQRRRISNKLFLGRKVEEVLEKVEEELSDLTISEASTISL